MLNWLRQLLSGQKNPEPNPPTRVLVTPPPVKSASPQPVKVPPPSPTEQPNAQPGIALTEANSPSKNFVAAPLPRSNPLSTQTQAAKTVQASTPSTVWIPAGQKVEVAGYTLPMGMIYVGKRLSAVNSRSTSDGCLINPNLPVHRHSPDYEGRGLDYWPSYSQISGECRAAYLEWVSRGRFDRTTNIGYVFLFFYGLERRVIHDIFITKTAAMEEIIPIIAEVERLLKIYGSNSSFKGYATSFLEICDLLRSPHRRYESHPPFRTSGWGMPCLLQVALGQLVAEERPIPADWALSWYIHSENQRLRTPATRCVEEFRKLFRIRYEHKYGQGLKIKPNKTRLKINYRAASSSLGQTEIELDAIGQLPDVTALSAPLNQIQVLVDSCTDELEPYSRWIGRNPEAKGSHTAIALLPIELVALHEGEGTKTFRQWLEQSLNQNQTSLIPARDLLRHWNPNVADKLIKADATMLSQFLEKQGYGIEPDIRFGGKVLTIEGNVVLFQLSSSPSKTASPDYAAATLLLHLAATVASADNEVDSSEQTYLEQHLESVLNLSEAERLRLRAHLKWLLQEKLSLRGLKTRLETVSPEQRQAIAQLLISVAGADGQVSAKEISTLTKIYPLLGIDPKDVYSHIHQLSTSSVTPRSATEPVTVRSASSTQKGFAIPDVSEIVSETIPKTAANEDQPQTPGFTLNMDLIATRKAESALVATILGDIFVDQEPLPTLPSPETNENAVAGLDAAHSTLVRRLAGQSIWTQDEFECLVAELGLMVNGALETINNAAFDRCDEALTEGEDPIEVNSEVLEELLS
jgi:uncharacterized tellurite resistance protein B-like protein